MNAVSIKGGSDLKIRTPGLTSFCLFYLTVFWIAIPVQAQTVTVTGVVEVAKSASQKTAPSNADVAVWLTPVGEAQGSVPKKKFTLVQRNKTFEPHVLVVPAGSEVDFPNKDPFFHNVFSLFDGKRFDLGLYERRAASVDERDAGDLLRNGHAVGLVEELEPRASVALAPGALDQLVERCVREPALVRPAVGLEE